MSILLFFVLCDQLKQTEGQSEAVKQKELQRRIDELKAEIGHLDSQIRGAEEHLETQGTATKLCNPLSVSLSLTQAKKCAISCLSFTFTYRAVNQLHLGPGGGQSSQRATPAGLQAAVPHGS